LASKICQHITLQKKSIAFLSLQDLQTDVRMSASGTAKKRPTCMEK